MAKTDQILRAMLKIFNSPRQRISEDEFKKITKKSKSSFYRYVAELTKFEDAEGVPILRRIKDGDQYWFELNKSMFKYFIPEHLESAYFMEAFKAIGYLLQNKQFNEDITFLKKDIFQLNGRSKELEKKFFYLSKIVTPKINEEILNITISSLIENRIISLEYSGKRYPNVFPLTLCQYRDALYLLAYKEQMGELRKFKIDRIERIIASNETFKYPNKWNPQDHFNESSGLVTNTVKTATIRVFGDSRKHFEEKEFFSSKQESSTDKYGRFKMKYSNENEFLGQLFVYAQDIEIESPEDLKDKFIKKALLALQHNDKKAA